MSITRVPPPLDYLRTASRTSLQSFELARRNHAANLRREIATLIDQWIVEMSEATMARWMLDHRESLHDLPQPASEILAPFPNSPADPLPDSPLVATEVAGAPPRFSDPRHPLGRPIAGKAQKQKTAAAG